LPGPKLVTMSVMEDRVSLNYQYRRRTDFNWSSFTSDLTKLAGTARVEVFIG